MHTKPLLAFAIAVLVLPNIVTAIYVNDSYPDWHTPLHRVISTAPDSFLCADDVCRLYYSWGQTYCDVPGYPDECTISAADICFPRQDGHDFNGHALPAHFYDNYALAAFQATPGTGGQEYECVWRSCSQVPDLCPRAEPDDVPEFNALALPVVLAGAALLVAVRRRRHA